MITPLDFLFDLFNPSLAFLPRALAAVTPASLVTGVVGCHVMMRGMVFIGDAVAHSVFPGLAGAFVIGGHLGVGGLAASALMGAVVILAELAPAHYLGARLLLLRGLTGRTLPH